MVGANWAQRDANKGTVRTKSMTVRFPSHSVTIPSQQRNVFTRPTKKHSDVPIEVLISCHTIYMQNCFLPSYYQHQNKTPQNFI